MLKKIHINANILNGVFQEILHWCSEVFCHWVIDLLILKMAYSYFVVGVLTKKGQQFLIWEIVGYINDNASLVRILSTTKGKDYHGEI